MAVVALVMLGEVFVTVQGLRPTPYLVVRGLVPSVIRTPGRALRLSWPSMGEAAADVPGISFLGAVGGGQSEPIASLTKMMTALVIVSDHPLSGDDQGPALTMSQEDVSDYFSGAEAQESVLAVQAGERLSERQCLEALLVGSADNVAGVLAKWDSGTEVSFVKKMNSSADFLSLRGTHYADDSGLDPASVSTASDQLRLGEVVEANPVLASIVKESEVTLPVAGVVRNTNYIVGRQGVIGIKTGDTSKAGGCYVFAADLSVGHRTRRVFGAVLGQGIGQPAPVTLPLAVDAGTTLLRSVSAMIATVTVYRSAAVVATLAAPWGAQTAAVTARPVRLAGWSGLQARVRFRGAGLGSAAAVDEDVGRLTVQLGDQDDSVAVRPEKAVDPPLSWKLGRL